MLNLSSLLEVIVPRTCLGCDVSLEIGSTQPLCLDCAARLPLCCGRIPNPVGLQQCWALGAYDGLLGQLVRRAKYDRSLFSADFLGRLLGARLIGLVEVDAVVPVPTTWPRRAWRGFDQSLRIGRGVSRALCGVPVHTLVRHGLGQQVGKPAVQRQQLSHRAFSFRCAVAPRRVLLVDDVVTTGTTLRRAAKALGREDVHRFALAKVL